MGRNGKAVVTLGMLLLEAPEHARVLLTYVVQLLPSWASYPEMVQASLLFFLVTVPVAAGGSWLVWRVKNQPEKSDAPKPEAERPLAA